MTRHLIVRDGVVVNAVEGSKPAGYRPTTDIWIAQEDAPAGAWIGWAVGDDGILVFPAPPPIDEEPAP